MQWPAARDWYDGRARATVAFAMPERMLRLTACLALLLGPLASAGARDLPAGFVYLRDVAPGIAQDMRYATDDNFTGRPLPGYQAGECVLRREVAAALARVQADLAHAHDREKWQPVFAKDHSPAKTLQLGLKVYDCYRPARAVAAFWRWSQSTRGGGQKRFYPRVPKSELFARGYIASHSRHSAGIAVDLTLIKLPAPTPAPFDRAAHYGPCTAPAEERAPDNALDMGTGFDCLDVKSYTKSGAVTRAQRHWRNVLKAAMAAHGFRNYFREWWHYEYAGAPRRAYDFPIVPRGER
jgi:zinc D-Ala-D-Ala dipeptidase